MAELNIRMATLEDVASLAEMKSDYVRTLYRGFISQDILNRSTPAFHAAMLTTWLESSMYQVAIMERDGQISGYIVYGNNPEEPFGGLIYEGVCDALSDMEEKRLLLMHTLQQLRQMGHTSACLWILVDNFRVRYLFETLGFRPDGERQVRETFGQELHIARYVYPL